MKFTKRKAFRLTGVGCFVDWPIAGCLAGSLGDASVDWSLMLAPLMLPGPHGLQPPYVARFEKEPAAQGRQRLRSSTEYVPGKHGVHVSDPAKPTVPFAHGSQAMEASLDLVPEAQRKHAVRSAFAIEPAAQREHVAAACVEM